MLFPSGNPFICHEEVLYLQPLIPPKRFDISPPLTGGCSEGLGAFWFFFKNAHSLYGGDCDAAIARAVAAVPHVQSQNQEVGSGDERLGLLCFDLSSAQTDFILMAGGRAVERLRLFHPREIVKHSEQKHTQHDNVWW